MPASSQYCQVGKLRLQRKPKTGRSVHRKPLHLKNPLSRDDEKRLKKQLPCQLDRVPFATEEVLHSLSIFWRRRGISLHDAHAPFTARWRGSESACSLSRSTIDVRIGNTSPNHRSKACAIYSARLKLFSPSESRLFLA
eukprot:892565-Pleurochrysis_carterae.AAC.3